MQHRNIDYIKFMHAQRNPFADSTDSLVQRKMAMLVQEVADKKWPQVSRPSTSSSLSSQKPNPANEYLQSRVQQLESVCATQSLQLTQLQQLNTHIDSRVAELARELSAVTVANANLSLQNAELSRELQESQKRVADRDEVLDALHYQVAQLQQDNLRQQQLTDQQRRDKLAAKEECRVLQQQVELLRQFVDDHTLQQQGLQQPESDVQQMRREIELLQHENTKGKLLCVQMMQELMSSSHQ